MAAATGPLQEEKKTQIRSKNSPSCRNKERKQLLIDTCASHTVFQRKQQT